MNLRADLAEIIKHEFASAGVNYDPTLGVDDLAASYFQVQTRMVAPAPRVVHFSNEIHDSLGELAKESDPTKRQSAKAAWGTVFYLRYLFADGKNVNGYLSRRIREATGTNSKDGLLFDYGMHHFHLNNTVDQDGFVERSDYLLFAVVTQKDVYFVDIRMHPNPHDLGWVRQDLMQIVDSNWPELIDANALRGVSPGESLSDEQKQELRRQNANHFSPVDGKVFVPLGGGTTGDGSSARCRWEAMRLLHAIDYHQRKFESERPALKNALKENGIDVASGMEFELVTLHSLDLPPEVHASLTAENCLSKDLSLMGFAVVERSTRSTIVVVK